MEPEVAPVTPSHPQIKYCLYRVKHEYRSSFCTNPLALAGVGVGVGASGTYRRCLLGYLVTLLASCHIV